MSDRLWFPFYPGDYKRKTSHLSTLESGAYLNLIMHYWDCGGLPSDETRIQRIAGLTDEQWTDSRSTLQGYFKNGWSYHDRIEEELKKRKAIAESCAERGKQGAKKRWKNNETNGYSHPLAIDQPMAKPMAKNSKHSTAHIKKDPQIFLKEDTPEFRAWDEYARRTTGRGCPVKDFGWWFDSPWPPGYKANGHAVP